MLEKELELLEAQHDFLNLQMHIAEQEANKSGKALAKDTTYSLRRPLPDEGFGQLNHLELEKFP